MESYPSSMSTQVNTETLLKVMQNPNIKMITHPAYSEYLVDIEKIAHEAVKRNILLEINISHFRAAHKMNPEYIKRIKKMIAICQENKHFLAINSDAHCAWEIGDDTPIKKMHKELGYQDKFIINNYPDKVLEFFGVEG